jgi:hypothetical protein
MSFYDSLAKLQEAFEGRLFDWVNIDFPYSIDMKVNKKYNFFK